MSVQIARVERAGLPESEHLGAFAVCDPDGRVVMAGGDVAAAVFPRSAVKAIQALPLVAEGYADKLGLADRHLALACASHVGDPVHVETAREMLALAGREPKCLLCGTQWPARASAARALAAAGQAASALTNNCSGKHAGFVCAAVAAGRDPAGYVEPDHPTMADVTAALSAVLRTRLDASNRGIDGCSIPSFTIPLQALAAGFARFGAGAGLPAGYAQAAARLRAAVASHPALIAGDGWQDTVITQTLGEAAFVKIGAEGVYAAALPTLGLGLAVKCRDGAARAAEASGAGLIAHLLRAELGAEAQAVLQRLANPVLRNWNGLEVGRVRAVISAS